MTYYKIIQDSQITGVGYTFLKWNARRNSYVYCDLSVAQCVRDEIKEILYHTDWLDNLPSGAKNCEEATVEVINATEYDELYELLNDGEEIPVPDEPEPEPEPSPEPIPDEEQPMTIAQMRAAIAALNAAVMTNNEPFKATKTYYIGDLITNGSRSYIASSVIVQDETVIPGTNCTEVTIADVINTMREQE